MSVPSLAALHEKQGVVVTAHRGFSCDFPENTLLSMEKAIEAGADMIEFDLRSSADDVPVVLHDKTVDRTSDGHGTPESMTFSELKKYNFSWWRKMRRLNEPFCEHLEIPAFGELLEAFHDKACMNIQIYLQSEKAMREACRLYKKFDMYDRGYMTIASEEVVAQVHAIDPAVAVCLTPGWNERATPENLRRCAALGCRFVQPTRESVSSETFELCAELGLRANVFYADCEADFARLCKLGAHGIMTNCTARLVNWLKEE